MKELKKQIGESLQRERENQKLTRKQAASLAELDENSYRKYEKGLLNITANTIERLFKALGKKVKLIVMDSNHKDKTNAKI